MEKHEVVIVGAGPGGLKAAKTLEEEGKEDILLVEALPKERIGDKFCGGWVPQRAIETIGIPDEIIFPVLNKGAFHFNGLTFDFYCKSIKMVNRLDLGQYQLSLLEKTELRDNTKVTDINPEKNYVTTADGDQIGYDYLIDGSGFKSPIRRKLLEKRENYWAFFGYMIKTKGLVDNTFHIYMYTDNPISVFFGLPHKNVFEVIVGYPIFGLIDKEIAKQHMKKIAESMGLSINDGEPKAAPVPLDYKGFRFGNIFLTGDAAGMPSTIFEDGIYQAAKSGEIAAKAISRKEYNWEKELNKTLLKHYDWGPLAWLPKVNGIINLGLSAVDKVTKKMDINISVPRFISFMAQDFVQNW